MENLNSFVFFFTCNVAQCDIFLKDLAKKIFERTCVYLRIRVLAKSVFARFDTVKKKKKKRVANIRRRASRPSPSSERTEFSCKFLQPLLAFTLRSATRTKLESKPGPRRNRCFSRAHRKPPPNPALL